MSMSEPYSLCTSRKTEPCKPTLQFGHICFACFSIKGRMTLIRLSQSSGLRLFANLLNRSFRSMHHIFQPFYSLSFPRNIVFLSSTVQWKDFLAIQLCSTLTLGWGSTPREVEISQTQSGGSQTRIHRDVASSTHHIARLQIVSSVPHSQARPSMQRSPANNQTWLGLHTSLQTGSNNCEGSAVMRGWSLHLLKMRAHLQRQLYCS